jgi:Zn-dependent membrane protease YugP
MYYSSYYGMDWTYILIIIGAIASLWAQARVKTTFHKYAKIQSRTGITGGETAEKMLRYAGISDVSIQHISGELTDNYDSSKKVLSLSDSTYYSNSVAAVGVAAHECGHAIQHFEGYQPLNIRKMLVPAANLGSKLGIPIVIAGIFLSYNYYLI